MSHEELTESLSHLKSEIGRLGDEDRDVRERLEKLVAEVESHLDEPSDEERRQRVDDELRDLIQGFEVEHPKVTGFLNRVMVTLSNLGI